MAHELFLARLWDVPAPPEGDDLAQRVRTAALAAIPAGDDRWHVTPLGHGQFDIETPHGDATVRRDHVSFHLHGFSSDLARLIHALAAAGGLAVVNEGGGPHFLLVDPHYLELLPPELREEGPVVCLTPDDLERVLAPQLAPPADALREEYEARALLYSRWTRDHVVRSIGHGDPDPNVPGLDGWQHFRPLYVEAKPKEGPLLLFRRFGRFHSALIAAHNQPLPKLGGVLGSSWQVRLPGGTVFTCWRVGGGPPHRDAETLDQSLARWMQLIGQFAATTGRRTATIEDRHFVLSDGARHPMSDCESRRARDEGE